jgi:hypothetical protein
MKECAEIMLRECVDALRLGSSLEKILFVVIDEDAKGTFEAVWKSMVSAG